ncbi:MAG: potassium channel protein [Candidatus Marinimicrobia bacterium]|nr:potassium channel protein [Candidatus Neomarinimicrobiota bacterium]
MILEGWSFTDAVYMTVTTISTVGYQEVHPLSVPGQWHVIILIILSIGTVAYALSYMTQRLIETRFFYRRKMEKSIQKMENHFIIAGYGRMGRKICSELNKYGKEYVVIEKNPDITGRIKEKGFYFVEGDVTDDGVLTAAGVVNAKGLVTVVDSDADNVYCTLTARSLNENIFIVSRSDSDRGTANLLRAGADKVINPYDAGGHAMAQVLLKPSAVEFIELTTGGENYGLEIDEIKISANSSLIGKTLATSEIKSNYNVLIAAIKNKEGSIKINPDSNMIISAGDTLIAFGQSENISKLESLENES